MGNPLDGVGPFDMIDIGQNITGLCQKTFENKKFVGIT